MTTLVIPNVPPEVLARLQRDAARTGRTVEEELLSRVDVSMAPTVDEPTTPRAGLVYIPSPEISAPYDLGLTSPGERIVPRDGGTSRLEFWFDEDKVAE